METVLRCELWFDTCTGTGPCVAFVGKAQTEIYKILCIGMKDDEYLLHRRYVGEKKKQVRMLL